MTALPGPAPRRRKRWPWVGSTVVLAAAAAGFGWRWLESKAQLEARRPFVGTRRPESPADPGRPGLVPEMGLRPGGKVHNRVRNPETGAVVLDRTGQLWWRVVNGRPQQGHYGNPVLNDLGLGPWDMVLHDGTMDWTIK